MDGGFNRSVVRRAPRRSHERDDRYNCGQHELTGDVGGAGRIDRLELAATSDVEVDGGVLAEDREGSQRQAQNDRRQRQNPTMSPRNEFASAKKRLSSFFEEDNCTNVRGLFLFGY